MSYKKMLSVVCLSYSTVTVISQRFHTCLSHVIKLIWRPVTLLPVSGIGRGREAEPTDSAFSSNPNPPFVAAHVQGSDRPGCQVRRPLEGDTNGLDLSAGWAGPTSQRPAR